MNDLREAEADPNREEIMFKGDSTNDLEDKRKGPLMSNKRLTDHHKREVDRLKTEMGSTRMTLQTMLAHNRALSAADEDWVVNDPPLYINPQVCLLWPRGVRTGN